jgi:hypothetical protein
MAPAELALPEAWPKGSEVLMAPHRILREEKKREVKRTILREAESRYRNEMMDDEERQLLLDRIKRLRRAGLPTR